MTLTHQGGPLVLENILLRESFQAFAVVFYQEEPAPSYSKLILRGPVVYSLPAFAKTYLALAGVPMDARVHLIAEERVRQIDKFGDQSFRTDDQWLHILLEEVGEVSKEHCEIMFFNEKISRACEEQHKLHSPEDAARLEMIDAFHFNIEARRANIVKESTQVAAVACAWFEAIYQRKK